MGFFTKPADVGRATPDLAPLSNERITATLDRCGWRYSIDSDGDVGGIWDGHMFYFLRFGKDKEILQVRGRWTRGVDPAERGRLLELVNDWNDGKVWPKAYVHVNDKGQAHVFAELGVDYEDGLSDAQLERHLRCAIATSLQLFEHLDEQYPEAAAAAKAAQA